MTALKCLGCLSLEREVIPVKGIDLVVYDCNQGHFPYKAALSGLLRPSTGIARAALECTQPDAGQCVVCGGPGEYPLGRPQIPLCNQHWAGWREWHRGHPEKREYFSPRRRLIHSRWLEVFLEFVAEARSVGIPPANP